VNGEVGLAVAVGVAIDIGFTIDALPAEFARRFGEFRLADEVEEIGRASCRERVS
jgi:hypothetical protein